MSNGNSVSTSSEIIAPGSFTGTKSVSRTEKVSPVYTMVLDSGRVLAEGTPDDVLSRKDVIDAYLGTADEEAA